VSKRSPMFDFTRVSQSVAGLLVAFLASAVVLGVIGLAMPDGVQTAFRWVLSTGFSIVFAAGACLLLVDFFRRLGQRSLSTTQVTGYRAAGVCVVLGSVFGIPATHGITIAICAVALVALLAPTRRRAQPSTWTYQG
jgi:hypothetical protein